VKAGVQVASLAGTTRRYAAKFLRKTERRKNGKRHPCWSVVERKRLDGERVVQRHVLYPGEIDSSQAEAWRRTTEVFDEDAGAPRSLSLFSEERCNAAAEGRRRRG
jgi:hypothetical protein